MSGGRMAIVQIDGGAAMYGTVLIERTGGLKTWTVTLPFVYTDSIPGEPITVSVGGLWGRPRHGKGFVASTINDVDRGETVILGDGPLEKRKRGKPRTYAHDAHCNVIHTPGPKPCPPACGHDWQASEFGALRWCLKCASAVKMRAAGLTLSGWTGEP